MASHFSSFLIGLLEENDKTLMRSQSGSALKSKGKITNRYRWSTDLNLRVNWSTLKISCFFLLERHLGSLASDYPLEWNEGDEEALSGVVIACQLPIMIIIIMASCTSVSSSAINKLPSDKVGLLLLWWPVLGDKWRITAPDKDGVDPYSGPDSCTAFSKKQRGKPRRVTSFVCPVLEPY